MLMTSPRRHRRRRRTLVLSTSSHDTRTRQAFEQFVAGASLLNFKRNNTYTMHVDGSVCVCVCVSEVGVECIGRQSPVEC